MRNKLLSKIMYQDKNFKSFIGCILIVALMLTCMHAFADDLLKGTETNLVDTINGTGKKYLYISEFVIACLAWLQARSVKAFFGVLVLSVGANIILKIGGII